MESGSRKTRRAGKEVVDKALKEWSTFTSKIMVMEFLDAKKRTSIDKYFE